MKVNPRVDAIASVKAAMAERREQKRREDEITAWKMRTPEEVARAAAQKKRDEAEALKQARYEANKAKTQKEQAAARERKGLPPVDLTASAPKRFIGGYYGGR